MAFEYARDDTRRRVVIRFIGPLTADEGCQVADRHHIEQVWGYAMVYDLTGVTVVPNRNDVQRVADYVQRLVEQRPHGPIAIVAPDAALFSLARLYAAFAGPTVRLNVFRNLTDAEEWLDTPGIDAPHR